MSLFDRRPALRWMVPAGAVALIAVGSAAGSLSAAADPGLPPRTAEQLLVALQQSQTRALSGTVVTHADLGLPALPGSSSRSADLGSLVDGERTVRVWADGPERARMALIGASSETDVVRDGDQVWVWSSDRRSADRYTVPEHPDGTPSPDLMAALPRTPQEAAQLVLGALDPTTSVATAGAQTVAGRPAYELLLTPKQPDTLVARVTLAVDAATSVPLRVQVYSTSQADPAFDVGFTSVDFGTPDASLFRFTPPPGSTVTVHPRTEVGEPASGDTSSPRPTVVGSGWSSVLVGRLPADVLSGMAGEAGSADGAAALLATLPRVSGTWGSGWVLRGTLFSAVVTDDGRTAVGAVAPEALYAALAGR